MIICIDSCVFIRGFEFPASDAARLIDLIDPNIELLIPRLVVSETIRNLRNVRHRSEFHHLFHNRLHAHIIDAPIPKELIDRYTSLGLREKGDAIIGAFAEWMRVDYLISDNRHFLQQLRTDAYRLVTPAQFLEQITNP